MEKGSPISLRGFFSRTLLTAFAGVILILASSVLVFRLSIETGVIAPANAGENEARSEIRRLGEEGSFTHDLDPTLYDYVYFDSKGTVQESSLEGDALAQTVERYSMDNTTFATGAYLFFEDGSSCLFTWSYEASFTNPVLRGLFPQVDIALVILAGIALIVFFLLLTRNRGRKLGEKLSLVEVASTQIAHQDLDTAIDTSAGIQEFNHTLESMEDMRKALKESLLEQWESQQQRKQEIAALAHDIKTPLTIINGNAELLKELTLDEEQEKLVTSIHTAGTQAKRYVSLLQQVSNMDSAHEDKEIVSAEEFMNSIESLTKPLALEKNVSLKMVCNVHEIPCYPFMLTRALVNVVENAIRFSDSGGLVELSIDNRGGRLEFQVTDEGPGFSSSALAHAKEMYWQDDKSRSVKNNYGIGLAMAEKVAHKHGGELILENISSGARVTLTLGK